MILDLEGKFVMSEEAGPVQPTVPASENIALDEAMEYGSPWLPSS